MTSTLHRLFDEGGQSPWLDNLRRGDLASGRLASLIAAGVRGLTSNPTIFQKSIQSSNDYDAQLSECMGRGLTPTEAYWEMVVDDIEAAAALFADVHASSGGDDGFVSVEVDPRLAHDAEGTIAAARGLRARISAPNVMIKIPATIEGLVAIRQMTAEGCSVNVTLIFSLERYRQVLDAHMAGLEDRRHAGGRLDGMRSVASFFISRVDTEIDELLTAVDTARALGMRGRSAINQARLAYALFEEARASQRWKVLEAAGARAQRPLWASTSTKNPAYPDTLYVDELIGTDSVNTLPEATLEAFADHGTVASTIRRDLDAARREWGQLSDLGIDVGAVAAKLERDGVASFVASFEDLISSLAAKSIP